MKLCINCVYREPFMEGSSGEFDMCNRAARRSRPNPVNGDTYREGLVLCMDARRPKGNCGPSGKLFVELFVPATPEPRRRSWLKRLLGLTVLVVALTLSGQVMAKGGGGGGHGGGGHASAGHSVSEGHGSYGAHESEAGYSHETESRPSGYTSSWWLFHGRSHVSSETSVTTVPSTTSSTPVQGSDDGIGFMAGVGLILVLGAALIFMSSAAEII